MFYRICRLRALNIQLIFVFDGPSRPWKRGKSGGGLIDYRERDLLKEMLTCFGIPFDEAPGEAEAECAHADIWLSRRSRVTEFGLSYVWLHLLDPR
jgi:Holliday junction resolvase YEN1